VGCLLVILVALMPWAAGGITWALSGSAITGTAGFAAGMLVALSSLQSMSRYEYDKAMMEVRQEAMQVSERIQAVADPLIVHGYTPAMVQQAVLQALGIGIGGGSSGINSAAAYPGPTGQLAACPYCGATKGGEHGGFCPNAAADS
jgi:hypothetical protein